MYISFNQYGLVTGVSDDYFESEGCITQQVPYIKSSQRHELIGSKFNKCSKKKVKDLKIAFVCNWNDACGISTYTSFLVEALSAKVKEIKIFSEKNDKPTQPDDNRVIRCWERGESMVSTMRELKVWNPDFVIIQHEFGIFPKATHFLQMLQELDEIPYIVTLHSVYRHLDKTICTSAIKNILVHSEQGKQCLRDLGHDQNIFVVPHGCFKYNDCKELWNIFQTPYVLVQFGFGFFYKGVNKAIDAIHHLKTTDPKFKDIFYVYLCSDSGHFQSVHGEYYNFLMDKIEKLSLTDNVSIIRKYHTDATINNYLRCAKIALFPYITDPEHVVYGASGAIRVAMANGIPVIASDCYMFDDLEGVVPRPKDHIELAREIDEIFSNDLYRASILERVDDYINSNNWDTIADRYLEIYKNIE